jgi:hypothetical protein
MTKKRKTDKDLNDHIESLTLVVKGKITDASGLIMDRRENLKRKHEELMVITHDHMAESSRLYQKAVDKQVAVLQMSVQSERRGVGARSQVRGKEGQG